MWSIKFFIIHLFTPRASRFLRSAALHSLNNLKTNKEFKKLKYSQIERFANFLAKNPVGFIVIFISILFSSVYITEAFFLSGLIKQYNDSGFLTDSITIQCALFFALIAFFPLAALFQSARFTDSSIKEEVIKVIKQETRIFELISSSALLLIYLLYLCYMIQIGILSKLNFLLASLVLSWLFINISGICCLIWRGFYLLKPLVRNKKLIRYVANEVYPLELTNALSKNIYLALGQDNDVNECKPKVNVLLSSDNGGKEQASIYLSDSRFLYDIDLKKINYVISQWRKRNFIEKNLSRTLTRSLIFPLILGKKYEGKVCLCQVINGTDLTNEEKFLIKSAFKFKKIELTEEMACIERVMKILEESCLDAIKIKNPTNFCSALNQQIDFHVTLINLGEIENKDGCFNYCELPSSKFLFDLNQEWSSSYYDIFNKSVYELSDDSSFFRQCCLIGPNLISAFLQNPSSAGIISTIKAQGFLWFRLNEKWEKSLPHDKYNVALDSFNEGWRMMQSDIISQNNNEISWDKYRNIFLAMEEHFEHLLSFAAESIRTNNRDAAYHYADLIIRWNSNNTINFNIKDNFSFLDNLQQVYLSPSLLLKDWESAKDILSKQSKYKIEFTEKEVFSAILENYWRDGCFVFLCVILKWQESLDSSIASLITEVVSKILAGQSYDGATFFGENIFLKNLDDYLVYFLRITIGSKKDYFNRLTSLAKRLNDLTSRRKRSGVIYSCRVVASDITQEIGLLIGACVAHANPDFHVSFQDVDRIFFDYGTVMQLIDKLDKNIQLLSGMSIGKYNDFLQKINITYTPFLNVIKPRLDKTSFNAPEDNGITVLIEFFSFLKEKAITWRISKIKITPVSNLLLRDIEEEASSNIFNKDTATFPVCFFQRVSVDLSDEPFVEFKLGYSDFPKGALTEPLMSEEIYKNLKHNEFVSNHLYVYLISDIYDKAKKDNLIQEIPVTDEENYLTIINECAQKIRLAGLTPILIVEDFNLPKWLVDWNASRWDTSKVLPIGLCIEYKKEDKERQPNYLFHINDTPTYKGHALIGGSLLLSCESLKSLKFKQLKNGYPLEVRFEENIEGDLTKGNLIFYLEEIIELESYPMYKIKFS